MRNNFPLLQNHKKLIYLDSAATALTPKCVIEVMSNFSEHSYSSVHRGLYPLAVEASRAYEAARKTVADFIHADVNEIIFTKGATESLNAIAQMLPSILAKGRNEVVLTEMEHHANIVPWQQLAKQFGFKIKYIALTKQFDLDYEAAKKLITKKTAVVSFTHLSNTLGTVTNVKKLCKLAKDVGAYSVIDGAQSVAQVPIDVSKINCDFFVFSGHKLYGPTGIGVLYGKRVLLEKLEPYHTGGNMIESVSKTGATWAEVPHKFEAGTTPFVQAIGLARAIEFFMKQRKDLVQKLTNYTYSQLKKITEIQIIGPIKPTGLVSFTIKGIHPHDIADMLGENNICVRGGHHCTMPLHKKLGLAGTTRISLGLYTTKSDIDTCITEIKKIIEVFK